MVYNGSIIRPGPHNPHHSADTVPSHFLGEATKAEYQQLFDAGADRSFCAHETRNADHYQQLHQRVYWHLNSNVSGT